MTDEPSNRCVFCDRAFAFPDGRGGIEWVITAGTPDCEHETIDGRS